MANFRDALPFLFAHEGGYSNHPSDKGGETNFGITEATARSYGYTGPMRDLPIEVAEEIYSIEYWKFSNVKSQAVATKLLDMSANFGPRMATVLAQRAVNTLVEPATQEDGNWGPDTEESVNAAPEKEMLEALSAVSSEHYQAIAAKDPSQQVFLKGWLKRAMDTPEFQIGASGVLLVAVGIGAYLLFGRGK